MPGENIVPVCLPIYDFEKAGKEGFQMKKSRILGLVATACTVLATLVATSACLFYFYQPEEPASLSDK